MTSANSWSVILAVSGLAKLRTFIALPAGVSPLPSAPWQATHFCLYVAALLSSDFAGKESIAAAISRPAPRVIRIAQFPFIICFLLFRKIVTANQRSAAWQLF